MATTDIHPITQTVARSLEYIMGDKVETVVKDDIADSIKYAMNDKTGEITYHTLTSTLNCSSPNNPVEDFYELMNTFGLKEIENGSNKTKDGKAIIAWHLIQSFDGQVDPRIANEVGVKLAQELFPDCPVVISTHTNTENTHNHIEFCAWNFEGKKYNYDHKAYDLIRETSDRLCDEYGLGVIEHTRERKLVSWTDNDGRTRYYEPTDRKNELIRARKEGKAEHDDVNSYRNSPQYKESEKKKQTNIEIVKTAIDILLPVATSYEHLLFMLREEGFKITDKKKNGDWLKHITFTPPSAEKGVRDYTIGEGEYYTRENLTKVIDEINAEKNKEKVRDVHPEILYYEKYEYGKIDVQNINEECRKDLNKDGTFRIEKRGEPEKDIIRDVKAKDVIVRKYVDASRLDRMVEQMKYESKSGKMSQRQEEYLVRQIQDSFNNLRFMEEKQVYSYTQINEVVKGLWVQRNACQDKIFEAELLLKKLEYVASTPEKVKELVAKIEYNSENDKYYYLEGRSQDMRQARQLLDTMNKYNLNDDAGKVAMADKIQNYRNQIERLKSNLDYLSNELSSYDKCVSVLRRTDKDLGINRNEFFYEYDRIKKSGGNYSSQQSAQNREEQKSQKDRGR